MPGDPYCECLGVVPGLPTRCENLMTQEDMLCDRCREKCASPEGDAERERYREAAAVIKRLTGKDVFGNMDPKK